MFKQSLLNFQPVALKLMLNQAIIYTSVYWFYFAPLARCNEKNFSELMSKIADP
jgi:hypothetical protein